MKKESIRRSITIPYLLDNRISLMTKQYSYRNKNDLIIELLELGIIKFDEDERTKKLLYTLIQKVDTLLSELENKNV